MSAVFDIAIIGAGIAGASLAAELAGTARVLLIEGEAQPGYHATGRSAAFWTESYGGPDIQPLTSASGPWLKQHGFLVSRGALTIGCEDRAAALDEFAAGFTALGVRVERLEGASVAALIPGLRPQWTQAALEPDCCDIDVAALHQHYLRAARRGGGELWCSARLERAERSGGTWHLSLAGGRSASAAVVVNSAGAWADTVARMAGASTLSITPYRRTMAQLRISPEAPAHLPLVLDINERFYFKPEAGRLWLSPHDEIPSLPCDVAAEEVDVASAIDRLAQVTDWQIDKVEHRWAGLRSFAPDRLPVYGFDPASAGFFWFAGQGGFGIQTAPAAAQLAAGLLRGQAAAGVIDPKTYSPERFR